ncbi:MAG: hypothetical protein ABSF23_09655 [Terracidiphilus sp.]|jgi:uncharacterized membrane protein YpjA
MVAWTRAVLLGILSWSIPFFAGFFLFQVKKSNAPLFTTLMYLVVLITAGALLAFYFRRRRVSVVGALVVGTMWLAINLILDFPMFAFGPMKMTPLDYYSEIGLVYLTYPILAVLATSFRALAEPPEERAVER